MKHQAFVQHGGAPTEAAQAGDEHLGRGHAEQRLSRIVVHDDVNLWQDLITSSGWNESKRMEFNHQKPSPQNHGNCDMSAIMEVLRLRSK